MNLESKKLIYRHRKINQCGATEIIGTMALLLIAISAISTLYIQALSNNEITDEPVNTIIGRMDTGEVFLDYIKGKPLDVYSRVRFLIAGNFQINRLVRDLLNPEDYEDGFWNIGEKLYYGDILDSNVRVEASIVDVNSNSMVFWGVLQDGLIFNSKGGLWHLNETSGNIANDSTGHKNDGLVHGANWFSPGKDNGALEFDGLDDLVAVEDSYSLRFDNSITVEVWLQPEEDKFSIDTREYNAKFSYDPKITHIFDDIYAIIGEGQIQEGILTTVRITPEGEIYDVIGINTSIFADSTSASGLLEAEILHLEDGLCAITYINKTADIVVKTIRIAEDGQIENPNDYIDSIDFTPKKGIDPYIMKVKDDIFAVLYGGGNGSLNTIQILNDGNISEIPNENTLEFEINDCIDPHILKISDTVYSIVYGSKASGIMKTVEILDNGYISPIIDELIFENVDCLHPELVEVEDDIFAILYESKSQGKLLTIQISNDGYINPIIIDDYIFLDSKFLGPDIIKINENIFGVVFQGSSSYGIIKTIEILTDGSINTNILSNRNFEDTQLCATPNIVNVTSHVYAVVYEGQSPHPGMLKTLRLVDTSLNTGLSNGVYKENCFGIYADQENVYASINDYTISTPFSYTDDGWNHVVLTFNNSLSNQQIKLYVNGEEKSTLTYSGIINANSLPLIFGKGFIGLIDEIAIYEIPASSDDIYWNYNNPHQPRYRYGQH